MTMLVFLLEEPSARAALEGWLPGVLPDHVQVKYVVYEGKQDLETRMARQMRAWRVPGSRFIVLRDQDSGDCRRIKEELVARCHDAKRPDTLVRIACRQLEAWFIGDWAAVAEAFVNPKLGELRGKALYRDPDRIGSPVNELRKHIPTYQKVDGARRIGRHLSLDRSRSTSFRFFADAVVRLAREA